ncbi:hypothetical protein ASPFODRAFT_585009 [Aspergillus luchuensis CBS 106.47]|uniref:Uncharacterized protein n=1 Tax=Aspergillus luchuensis (strain CBS 106.47) TaxID=1137211 RepID=A0A1M3TLL9_ASPLC|nr:hypothetical protein ASPFODRAFT_585009 [Aspergillus luchuensis CBS 106.47]
MRNRSSHDRPLFLRIGWQATRPDSISQSLVHTGPPLLADQHCPRNFLMTRKGDPKPNGAVVAVVQALGGHVWGLLIIALPACLHHPHPFTRPLWPECWILTVSDSSSSLSPLLFSR